MNKGIRYFNFPVQLLRGFLVTPRDVLRNIFDYCLFAHTLEADDYDDDEDAEIERKMALAAKFYDVKIGNIKASYQRGKKLYTSMSKRCPHCGLNVKIFWDYHDNIKTDFERACLLTFLAIKSILGPKHHCKITNKFIISRMDGHAAQSDNISLEVQNFTKEYQFGKIKNELELNWHMVSYGKAVRGFYVSFDLNLDELAYIAEMNREKYRVSKLRHDKKMAAEKARERIKNERSGSRPI